MELLSRLEDIKAQSKRVLVVGVGVTGYHTAQIFSAAGFQVLAIDRDLEERFVARPEGEAKLDKLKSAGVRVLFGIEGREIEPELAGVGLAVLSPGVKLEGGVVASLQSAGVPLIGEVELALTLLRRKAIVVTGSNGKSTTSSLIAALLRSGEVPVKLCGNIGVPVISEVRSEHFTSQVDGAKDGWLVVEASSYQLEGCATLKPDIGVFLNLSENHLERHGTMERYFAAKRRAFELQDGSSLLISNSDDSYGQRLLRASRAKLAPFGIAQSAMREFDGDSWKCELYRERDGQIKKLILSTPEGEESYELSTCRLIGKHTRYDIAAALLAARRVGVAPEACQRGLGHFAPLPHRFELISGRTQEASSVLVVNDSKSTTVAAATAALIAAFDAFPGRDLTVLIGGLAKAGSWDPLMRAVPAELRGRVKFVCFGQDAALLSSYCKTHGFNFQQLGGLEQATRVVLQGAQPGEVVLLSPGCASFDEFRDFEHRGDMFKSWCGAH